MEPTDQNRRAWDEAHRAHRGDRRRGLPAPVGQALADLHGKRVLNLCIGAGEAAAELAELGATVTAVDSSAQALAAARGRWPSILWIHSAAPALPQELRRGRFDLVYAAEGTLDSLDAVGSWSAEIASALAPSGDLLLYDEHPVARSVDGLMRWREGYFTGGVRLGQIVTALARAGLIIRALEEYPQHAKNARHHDARVPGTFLLHARRS